MNQVLRSPGQPLDAKTRTYMEPHFGHDFSHVRVHTDATAEKSAEEVQALAYTVGRNIVFASQQYRPNTSAGRLLLAHELTHVVQQKNIPSSIIQRQGGAAAAARQAAFWVATQAVATGGGGFRVSNTQFRFTPHSRGEAREAEIPLLHLRDIGGAGAGGLGILTQQLVTAGTGFSEAEILLRISYDGQNILWGETEVLMVDGYEGGNWGSEAEVEFRATPSSHQEDPVAKVRIIFSGFTNPIGLGFHRFSGSFFVNANGRIENPNIHITQGGGWAIMNRTAHIFDVGWAAEPSRPRQGPSQAPLYSSPRVEDLLE